MCTITYIPTQNGYITTQNRDESPLREKAIFPITDTINNEPVLFPKDPEGSGSWFVSTKGGLTICVMNALYHPDKTSADFKHSRGLVPMHYLEFTSSEQFVENYTFKGVQGFTLIVCSKEKVDEIHWDETHVTHNAFEPKPLIFQSNPLYNTKQKALRKHWFENWLDVNDSANVLEFHKDQRQENLSESILMDRHFVRTISITQRAFLSNSDEILYAEVENLKNFQKINF